MIFLKKKHHSTSLACYKSNGDAAGFDASWANILFALVVILCEHVCILASVALERQPLLILSEWFLVVPKTCISMQNCSLNTWKAFLFLWCIFTWLFVVKCNRTSTKQQQKTHIWMPYLKVNSCCCKKNHAATYTSSFMKIK